MERLRQFFGCMTDPNPSPPNSSTEDKPQTDRKTAGIANHAGETFFHGVKHLKMKKPTFIQQIIHGGNPSTSRSDPLSTFNTDASIAVGLMNGNHQVDQNSELNEADTSVVHPGREHQIIETTIRAPFEIYHEELLKQKRGLPLWFPGLSLDLPLTYRREGINVGDVGIMHLDEPFDFLFNIFLPANHPINSKGVPDSFRPLRGCDTSEIPCDMQSGSVGSPSVRRYVDSESPGLTFETSAPEGAILVLPQGSSRKSIRSLRSIRDYMTPSNVQSWYQYASKHGREVQNGDIIIVHKCDKASSWGIATVSSVEGQTTSLTFKQVNGDQPMTPTYDWVCNGTANTQMKIGPSPDENRDIFGVVKNQCVFLQTLNARLSDRIWRKLEQRVGTKVDEGLHDREDFRYPEFVEGTSKRPLLASAAPTTQGKSQKRVLTYPSSVLNICLLENCQNAKMAITTDEDWIPLMTQEGTLLPSQELFVQIQQSNNIRNKDGVVFLDPLNNTPSQSDSSIAGLIGRCFSFQFSEAEKALKIATNALYEYQSSQEEQHLATAISHYRHAYETSNEKHRKYIDILINYAAVLNWQEQLSGGGKLQEVVHLLEEGRGIIEKRTHRTDRNYGILLNNLGQAYLHQYQKSRATEALTSATEAFEQARSQGVSSPGSITYASSLIGSATALWNACELQPQADGDLDRLKLAIDYLEDAQRQNAVISIQAECYRNLASCHALLYKRTRKRDDLDLSIDYYTQALGELSPHRASTLFNLAKQQFERFMLTKDRTFMNAAEENIEAAKKFVDQAPGGKELEGQIAVMATMMSLSNYHWEMAPSVISSRSSVRTRRSGRSSLVSIKEDLGNSKSISLES